MELMVSMAILGLIMVVLFSIFEEVNKAWLNGENRVETFTQARAILDLMSREISQAVATPNVQFYGDSQKIYFVAPVNTAPANKADLCEVGYVFDPVKLTFTRDLTEPTAPNIASAAWNIYAPTWWSSGTFDKQSVLENPTNILNVTFQYFDPAQNKWVAPYPNNNKLPSAVQVYVDTVDSRTVSRLRLVNNVGTAWQAITNSTLRSFSTIVYLSNISP
jgi:hypothetical protein